MSTLSTHIPRGISLKEDMTVQVSGTFAGAELRISVSEDLGVTWNLAHTIIQPLRIRLHNKDAYCRFDIVKQSPTTNINVDYHNTPLVVDFTFTEVS